MSNWIRTDYVFGDKRAVFTLPCQSGYGKALFAISSNEPDRLEAALRDIVLKSRPELEGCVIYFMRYAAEYHCWEIGVSHDSLPVTDTACYSTRIPLDKERERMEACR